MSSPAPLAKGRRSRKQTLGSENTETTLSSSAVSQSASLARAAAGVGDRRYRFSSRSDRRVADLRWSVFDDGLDQFGLYHPMVGFRRLCNDTLEFRIAQHRRHEQRRI